MVNSFKLNLDSFYFIFVIGSDQLFMFEDLGRKVVTLTSTICLELIPFELMDFFIVDVDMQF